MNERSRASRKAHARHKRDGMLFAAFPYEVLQSRQLVALSAPAIKLLIDFMSQYRGGNNGDFCAAWSTMEARGWRSRDTLAKALAELIGGGFVQQTRQGGRHAPSLYAITFYALDDSPKLSIRASDFKRSKWANTPPVTRPSRPQRSTTALRVVAGGKR